MKDYISVSQIHQFMFCPVAFRLQYEDLKDDEKEKPNIYLVYGSALHSALELNFKQKIKSRKDLPVEEITDEFKTVFWKEAKHASLFADPKSLALIGENVLTKYMEEKAKGIQPLLVEHRFELKLKSYPITIVGVIDLITEEGVIKDHKTVGKTTERKWTQNTVDDSIQLTFYSAAYRKIFQKKEKGLEIEIIPRNNRPVFKTITTQRNEEQIHRVLYLASLIQEMKEKKIFIPNLFECRGCFYKEICKRK